jgi:hypothetical protein
MKIGRNAPCPCGRGKKFKHCCLNVWREEDWAQRVLPKGALSSQRGRSSVRQIEGFDYWLNAHVEDHTPALMLAMIAQVRRAILKAKQSPQWAAANYEALRVGLLITVIQDESRIILEEAGHSTHYQYQLVRRLIPIIARTVGFDWCGPHSEALRSSDFLIEVIRCATRLVLAGGKPTEADETPAEWSSGKAGQGINYNPAIYDGIVACAKVIALATLWHNCDVMFRYANKGHAIFDQNGVPVDLSRNNKDDIEGYEERRDRYQTIVGASGFWIDRDRYLPLKPPLCGWFNLTSPRDTRHTFSCTKGSQRFSAYYVCIPLIDTGCFGFGRGAQIDETKQLSDYQRSLRILPYDRLIKERGEWYRALLGGVAPEATSAFLYSLYSLVRTECGFENLEIGGPDGLSCEWPAEGAPAIDKLREAGQLGMIRADANGWLKTLLTHSQALSASDQSVHKLSASEAEQLISAFSLLPGQILDRNEPRLFVMPSGRLLSLDLVLAVDFLAQLLGWPATAYNEGHPVLMARKLGDPVGDHLERVSFDYFVNRFNLKGESCLINRDVGGTEVDIAFVLQRVLFVIDCKAKSKNWEYTRGYHRVIRNRATDFRTELRDKLPRRIRLLKEGGASQVIEPASFDHAIGLVCTTAVEYLPLNEPLFWQNGVPLVGPPDELSNSIDHLVD